jgi:hypothetical protein
MSVSSECALKYVDSIPELISVAFSFRSRNWNEQKIDKERKVGHDKQPFSIPEDDEYS